MATTSRTVFLSVTMAAFILLIYSAAPALAGPASEAIQRIHERALEVLHD
ncbi:MAG TPA: hypothetical protein VJ692_03855 [Nitrospiraceae bacterium]|nr:hypothetical protein [Nitrospiraceae bacterium]